MPKSIKTSILFFLLLLGSFGYGQNLPKKLMPNIGITNQTPIKNLLVGETFTAGDFPIKILEISGGLGSFSGKGYVTVPYLNDTKIAVAFENIKINTNYQLIDGVVETAYDPDWKNIADVEDLTATGDNGEVLTKEVPYQIVNITTDANGDIKVNGSNGEQIIIPGGSALTITDSSGKVYTVDSQGEASGPYVAAAGGATTPSNTAGVAASKGNQPAQVTAITATGIKVTFEPTKNTLYAFDKCPKDAPDNIKNQYKKVGNDYLVYKAVPKGKTDYIFAKVAISDSNINKDKLVFKTITGIEIEKEPLDDGFLLTLKGIHNYVEEEVIATLKQDGKDQIAGAFKLVHLSEKTINLTLVPLNSSSSIPADAAVNLQTIYAKAGIKLNIKIAPVLPYDGGADKAITTSESGIFDYYTDEEKAINAQIKALATYDKDSYYLIYSNLPSTKGIDGFMALGGQFGYVFPNASGRTAAHELGHGVFILEHPFASESDKAKTPFLLDYGNGTELWHQNWAQINNPKLKFYGFQKDSGGELAGKTWFTPDWKPLKLKTTTIINSFAGHPKGTVPGVIFNGISYKYQNGKYLNIKNETLPTTEIESVNPSNKDEIYLYVVGNDLCNVPTYSTTYEYAIANKENINYSNSLVIPKEVWKCPKNNVESSYQIITQDADKTLQKFYEDLKTTYNKAIAFYKNCSNQQWKPGKEPGIIPKCFWEKTTTDEKNYYEIKDVAFMSGVIDGGYAELDGIVKMIDLLMSGKIEEKINDLAYAYTWAYLECKDKDIKLNKAEYKSLLNKLEQAQQSTGIWSWVKEKYYEPKVEDLGKEINKCEDANQLRADIADALTEIKEVIDSWEEIKALTKNIKNKLSNYYNLVTNKTNIGRYEAGRLIIPVGSTVIPIVGQIGKVSKISKTKTVLKGIEDLSETKADDLVEKLIIKGKKENLLSVIRQLLSKPSYLPNRIIWSKPNKTITFIGKWSEEIAGQQNGLQKVFGELSESDLNIYMQSGKFDHPGGFNMLSIEGWTTTVVEEAAKKGIMRDTKAFDDFIWDTYNRPWIESAMQRGDDIIIWSNPNNLPVKVFKDGVGITFYERELEFLKINSSKYGYDYNKGINLGTFSK